MASASRLRLAFIMALAVCASGLVLVATDACLVGWEFALRWSLNDPAKSYFHVVILPLATFVFVASYPVERMRSVLGNRSACAAACALSLLLIAGNLLFVIGDSRRGFEERIAPPQSFAQARVRDRLQIADTSLRRLLEPDESGSHELAKTAMSSVVKGGSGWHPPTDGLQASEQFRTLTDLLISSAGDAVDFSDKGMSKAFTRDASIRVWIAAALTGIGVLLPMAWFWTVVLYRAGPGWALYSAPDEQDRFTAGASLTLTLLASWMLLKIYSEWYSKFYTDAWSKQGEVIVALVATVGAFWLLWISRTNIGRIGVALTGILTALTFVAGMVAKFQPSAVGFVAEKYRSLANHELVLVHLVLLFVLGGIVLAWKQDAVPPAFKPDPEPDNW